MNERLEYQQLECYKLANDMQKEKLNREPYFDLGKLPGKQLQTEFAEYIYYRPIRKTACWTGKKTSGLNS